MEVVNRAANIRDAVKLYIFNKVKAVVRVAAGVNPAIILLGIALLSVVLLGVVLLKVILLSIITGPVLVKAVPKTLIIVLIRPGSKVKVPFSEL